jgi:hypothetical protein
MLSFETEGLRRERFANDRDAFFEQLPARLHVRGEVRYVIRQCRGICCPNVLSQC